MNPTDEAGLTSQVEAEHMRADEQQIIAEGVAIANIPVLLLVLVQLTGEMRWLEPPYRVRRIRGMGDNDSGRLPEEIQAEIRDAALEAILAWRNGRPVAIPDPSPELLARMLSWSMGEDVDISFGPLMRAQYGFDNLLAEPIENVPDGFSVLIIGAGMHGICAAVNLQAAGIPFTVIERSGAVGGVWHENNYPGAGVDSPSYLYSYTFAPHDWSMYFSLQEEIAEYFEYVVDCFNLRQSIELGVTVEAASYDSEAQEWAVDVHRFDGTTETLRANVVISAVGSFNPPKIPDIPGADSFAGVSFHTARWRHDVALEGKRVAVVGTGASAMQVCPAIQDDVASLTIFQREKQWAAPFDQYHKPIPEPIRYLLTHLPIYRNWYRTRLGWTFNDRLFDSLHKDPAWAHSDRSLNAVNDAHREFFTEYIHEELGDRTDLLDSVVPTYPPFGKRMLMDNQWFQMLKNPCVTLVADGVREIRPHSIVAADGREFDTDVIVFATGFDVTRFLSSYEVRGRSGRTLRETWDDDNARAYLGTCVPDFPNFFMLCGPNLQAGHGGSFFIVAEMTTRYIIDAIRRMVTDGIGALEVREEPFQVYNDAVDRAHDQMVWTHPGMSTYYRNSRGRVVVIYPFRNLDYFMETGAVDLDDFLTEASAGEVEHFLSDARAGSLPQSG